MARRIDRSGRVQMTRLNWAPTIAEARVIVESYDTPVTLRQLFYRLVARQLIPHPPGHRGIEIVVAGWQSAEGPRPGDDVPTVDDIHRIFFAPHRRGLESHSRGSWTR
jgi:hypothetical protein